MIQYIETKSDGEMVCTYNINLPSTVPTPSVAGNLIVSNPASITCWPACPTPTSKAYFISGIISVVEKATVAQLITAALDKPRTDINAVVWDAVGNLTEEYKDAEVDARAYRASGYTGTVPKSVNCYALHNPTGVAQTGQWAADNIITRADAFAVATLAMRENRFASQSAMRAATTLAELDAATAAWTSFIAGLRAELGLQPPQGTQ